MTDSRKIFFRVVILEDTVNLTVMHWCLKVSAKALCSLGLLSYKATLSSISGL